LASTTSNNFALEFYKSVSTHIFNEVDKLCSSVNTFIFFSETDDLQKTKDWVNKEFHFISQTGKDLGEKMLNAFKYLFEQNYEKVVILGSDIPDLVEVNIKQAFEVLESNDIVISPSDDGGYSLLGMNNFYPELFKNVEWSTNTVFSSTKEKIKSKKLSFKTLSTLNDIDTKEELINWIHKSKNIELVKKIENNVRKESIKL